MRLGTHWLTPPLYMCPMPLGFEVIACPKPRQGWNVYRDVSRLTSFFVFSGTHGRSVGQCVSPAQFTRRSTFGARETHCPTERPWVPEKTKDYRGVSSVYKHCTPAGVFNHIDDYCQPFLARNSSR